MGNCWVRSTVFSYKVMHNVPWPILYHSEPILPAYLSGDSSSPLCACVGNPRQTSMLLFPYLQKHTIPHSVAKLIDTELSIILIKNNFYVYTLIQLKLSTTDSTGVYWIQDLSCISLKFMRCYIETSLLFVPCKNGSWCTFLFFSENKIKVFTVRDCFAEIKLWMISCSSYTICIFKTFFELA